MTTPEPPSSQQLLRLVNGYQVAQALHVAAVLGIADELAGGSRSPAELAGAVGADEDALYRLLRALASLDVLHELDGRRFELAPLGEFLRSDVPGSVAGWAAFIGRPSIWTAWGALLHSVRTGENAFGSVHGEDVWTYRSTRPEESAVFDRAMTALTGTVDRAVATDYDFGRFGTVADVGGGRGTLLAAILDRHPGVRGVLFDQPHVVQGADLGAVADRCQVVGGSFFEAVPAGADAYVLKAIIHDWEDPESVAILRVCRQAMDESAVLLLVERDLGPPNADPPAKLSDLNMLVGPGGRERTVDEYGALFEQARLRLTGVTPTAGGLQILEGSPG